MKLTPIAEHPILRLVTDYAHRCGDIAYAFDTESRDAAHERANATWGQIAAAVLALQSDAMTMALRLYAESDDTFAPETIAVMSRWRPLVEAKLADVGGTA